MRFCIHRGTHEIGGTCVEIESQGKRIVLDIGLPLDVDDAESMPLHPVPGFDKPDPSLLGVLISHPHPDHYGLAHRLPPETPFLIGEAAEAILAAADLFTPMGLILKNVTHLRHREPIKLGPFTITPFLVDHSAYDSYPPSILERHSCIPARESAIPHHSRPSVRVGESAEGLPGLSG